MRTPVRLRSPITCQALRTNLSGGKTVEQLIAAAAQCFVHVTGGGATAHGDRRPGVMLLDVRERDAFERATCPGDPHSSWPAGTAGQPGPAGPSQAHRGNCGVGRVSTLAPPPCGEMGFTRAVALDKGMQQWIENGYPVESGLLIRAEVIQQDGVEFVRRLQRQHMPRLRNHLYIDEVGKIARIRPMGSSP